MGAATFRGGGGGGGKFQHMQLLECGKCREIIKIVLRKCFSILFTIIPHITTFEIGCASWFHISYISLFFITHALFKQTPYSTAVGSDMEKYILTRLKRMCFNLLILNVVQFALRH